MAREVAGYAEAVELDDQIQIQIQSRALALRIADSSTSENKPPITGRPGTVFVARLRDNARPSA